MTVDEACANGCVFAGVDEVGRGAIVADVVAAAVILPADSKQTFNDSKKLTAKQRDHAAAWLYKHAICIAIGRATSSEVDALNVLQASMLAMHRAVDALSVKPTFVAVDGNCLPEWPYASEAIIQGDQRVNAIAAASIIAKVTRDQDMQRLHQQYPMYGFANHKGYPTKAHKQAIMQYGITPVHRVSYRPVRDAIATLN